MRCFGGGCFGGNAVDPGTADIGTPVQHECGQSSCTVQNTVPQGLWAGDATPSSPGAQSSSSRCAPIFVSGDDIRMQHPDQYSKVGCVQIIGKTLRCCFRFTPQSYLTNTSNFCAVVCVGVHYTHSSSNTPRCITCHLGVWHSHKRLRSTVLATARAPHVYLRCSGNIATVQLPSDS